MGLPSRPTNGLSLCAGAGGLDLGLMLAEPGFHTRCFVEWEEYPRQSIIAAQRAGYFAPAPIWDDVTTFDGKPFRGAIDTVLAGYPCQPFSQAGQRKGASDERHLWPDVARIIREVDPEWVFLENVAGHVSLGLETVLRDLWDMGRTPAVGLFSASETGAPHERLRVFIVAHANGRNAGAERQQRGGEFGLHAEGGRADVRSLVYTGRSERRQSDTKGNKCDRTEAGWDESTDWPAKSGEHVDHAASARCDDARVWTGSDSEGRECLSGAGCRPLGNAAGLGCGEGRPEPIIRGGRDATTGAGSAMADTEGIREREPNDTISADTWRDTRGSSGRDGGRHDGPELADASGAGSQGQQSGICHPGERQDADGSSRSQIGARLFPPGPSDMAGWSDTLAIAPYLAPAAGLGDCLTWAANVAQALEIEGEAAVESRIRRMAHGMAARSRALRLLGNGVCPVAAGYAWRALATAHGLGALDLVAAGHSGSVATDEPVLRAAE